MTPNEFLYAVLKAQSLDSESDEVKAMQTEKDKVKALLHECFAECPIKIRYAGSWAKTTMIKESYDLDLTCYFNRDDDDAGGTLEDIYNRVREALQKQYAVDPKRSALRLSGKEGKAKGIYYHVDVIPGRFVDDEKDDAYLFQAEGEKKRLKTNVQKHIDHVKDSGLTDVIRLLKLWKHRTGLTELKTFILELLTIEVLQRSDAAKLDEALVKFWKKMKDEGADFVIKDPANPEGSDLSGIFNESVRSMLVSSASDALARAASGDWEGIFGPVSEPSKDERVAAFATLSSKSPDAPKPWCDVR